jgi:hypothetical protein
MTTAQTDLKGRRAEFEPILKALFSTDVSHPKTVRESLINFYNAVQKTRKQAHKGLAPDPVIRTVAEIVTEALAADFVIAFKNAPAIPAGNDKEHDQESLTEKEKFEEAKRFEALSRAFLLLAQEQDRLDHDRAKNGGDPKYHNNGHNLLVMAVRMIRERKKVAMEGKPATVRQINDLLRDLIAAAAHDFGHDGSNNRISIEFKAAGVEVTEGQYIPGRLELKSYNALHRCLREANVSGADQDFIKWQILATDFELPTAIAVYAYKRHFGGNIPADSREEIERKIRELPERHHALLNGFIEALEKDKAQAEAAMALKGCDMVPSYGLGELTWRQMCKMFHKEYIALKPDDPIVDKQDNPISSRQLFIALNLAGAKLVERHEGNNGNNGSRNGHELKAIFYDPYLQALFGANLEEIKEMAWEKTPQDVVRKVIGPLMDKLQPLNHN